MSLSKDMKPLQNQWYDFNAVSPHLQNWGRHHWIY